MSNIRPYQSAAPELDDSGADSYIVQAQNLLSQAVGQTLMAQAAIQKRMDVAEKSIADLSRQLRQLASNSDLITVVQLEVMLQLHWSDVEKQDVGTKLARYSRRSGCSPRKVPHPTLAGGVNGYEPGIVKAWLEDETEYRVPDVLRYLG